jgi:hypothetical protein
MSLALAVSEPAPPTPDRHRRPLEQPRRELLLSAAVLLAASLMLGPDLPPCPPAPAEPPDTRPSLPGRLTGA